MAKALFQKGQRVYVRPVGAWAVVEQVMPQWVKGVEEPLKVYYDVGLGREFQNHELMAEPQPDRAGTGYAGEDWRVVRGKSRFEPLGDKSRYPKPGTFPVVVTDAQDWGGWRVPRAEYDRDPERIEFQARAIAQVLPLVRLARDLAEAAELSPQMQAIKCAEFAKRADALLRLVYSEDDPSVEPSLPELPPLAGRR